MYVATAWLFGTPQKWRLELLGVGATMLVFSAISLAVALFGTFALNQVAPTGPGCTWSEFFLGNYCTTMRDRGGVFFAYLFATSGILSMVHGALSRARNVS